MLEELSIRNYALIDSITLSFRQGFNVLSGETGAGKSIIVGSLSFLLGGKAETDVIRTGCEEAGVSAVISVKKNNAEVTDWLKGRDIECEEDSVIVRRNIKTSGRGSAYIQNVPVTRQDLAEFTGLLFDLHGQHNHESLLKKKKTTAAILTVSPASKTRFLPFTGFFLSWPTSANLWKRL